MKILYLSCHEVLEYDEVRMLTDMGHEVFSLNGAYQTPGECSKRPGIPNLQLQPRLMELALQCSRENILPEIIEWADVVIVMHVPAWIKANWPKLKNKRVIWRSIGQSTPNVERELMPMRLEGLQIVRYSPRELSIPLSLGADAVIRFSKRPSELQGWLGLDDRPISFVQSARDRGTHCGYSLMEYIQSKIPSFTLFGNGNENSPFNGGLLRYEEQNQVLRQARAYFSACTHPASYVLNFMEALMVGVPTVVVGPRFGNPHMSGYNWDSYEQHELIEHGVSGLVADSPDEMVDCLQAILDDFDLAVSLSRGGRARAIELFDETKIAAQWGEFLGV